MYYFFVRSSVGEHLGYVHVPAIVNSAAVKIDTVFLTCFTLSSTTFALTLLWVSVHSVFSSIEQDSKLMPL